MVKRAGFTLIEALVSLAVFGIVMASAGSAYFQMKNNWQRQRDYLEALSNAQWAVEFFSNSVRPASNGTKVTQVTGPKTTLQYQVNNGWAIQYHWIWRGKNAGGGAYNNKTKLYHCLGPDETGNPPTACDQSTIEEVAGDVEDNPGTGKEDDMFVLYPSTGQPANRNRFCNFTITCAKNGQTVTLFTRVKMRNP